MNTSHELIWKLIDRTISLKEFDDLQQILSEDAELRFYFQDCLETNQSLQQLPSKDSPTEKLKQDNCRPLAKLRYDWLAAGLIAACLIIFVFLKKNQPHERSLQTSPAILTSGPLKFTPWDSGHTAPSGTGIASEIRTRALLAVTVTGTGGEAAGTLTAPHTLPCGVLELQKGWIELSFEGCAIVRLHGPVTFEILSNSSGYLYKGDLSVTDNGPGDHFTVFHDQGKVVDIGTAFAMRVGTGSDLDVYVQEGIVDLYDGVELSLDRLKEGDYFTSEGSLQPTITRLDTPPKWVSQNSHPRQEPLPTSPSPPSLRNLQTTTWLRGLFGSGQAAGNLAGVGIEIISDACHNSGEIHPMDWAQVLSEISPAIFWYHSESASIGVKHSQTTEPQSSLINVSLQGTVKDPVLLFGWGEKDLQVDFLENILKKRPPSLIHRSPSATRSLISEKPPRGKTLQNKLPQFSSEVNTVQRTPSASS